MLEWKENWRGYVLQKLPDGTHLVGHTKGYIQVLVVGPESMLGTSAIAKITSVGRWSVFGEVIEILNRGSALIESQANTNSPCSNSSETCARSKEPEPCACELTSSCGHTVEKIVSLPRTVPRPSEYSSQNLIGWLLRKWKNSFLEKTENETVLEYNENRRTSRRGCNWCPVDKALFGGILLSLLTIIALFLYLGSRSLSSK